MTTSQQQFLHDFRAVARGFDAGLQVHIEMCFGTAAGQDYAELNVRAYVPGFAGIAEKTVAFAKGSSKAEALTSLTAELRKVYAAEPVKTYATTAQKEDIIKVLNHPSFSKLRKTQVMLVLNKLSQEQAVAQLADLKAEVEQATGVAYGVVAEFQRSNVA